MAKDIPDALTTAIEDGDRALPRPVIDAPFLMDAQPHIRAVPVECGVAIEVNGIAFAVMMATPSDLEDFATGFALAEGLIGEAGDIRRIDACPTPDGIVLRLTLEGAARQAGLDRARRRVTESACGLCGVETLAALTAPLPRVVPLPLRPEAVRHALSRLRDHQKMGRATSGTHAAALCDVDGSIILCREDIGRHSALDKAIGAGVRRGLAFRDHFALVSSRLSYELVEKAARAGLGGLVAISAPSSLALDRAAAAGLPVIALARGDGMLVSDR